MKKESKNLSNLIRNENNEEYDTTKKKINHIIFSFDVMQNLKSSQLIEDNLNYKPIISIIIPTYNRGYLIDRAIRSVLNQTFKDFEIIIVDDNSTDNIENLIASYKDNRIRYLKHKTNRGAQAARNTGILNSKGDFLAFLDSDNEYLPKKLEMQYNAFCNFSQKVGVVYSFNYVRNEITNINTEWCFEFRGNIYRDLLKYLLIDFVTPLIRKECFEKIGLLDEKLPSAQDWDTFIRISKYYEFEYIPEKLAIYYIHKGERISSNILIEIKGCEDVINKYRVEILQECGEKELSRLYYWIATKYYDAKFYKLSFLCLIKSIKYDNKRFNMLIKIILPPKMIKLIRLMSRIVT